MTWEITDPKCVPGLVDVHFHDNILEWDFPLNSPNDLCAVFSYEPGCQLADYKRNSARPILYHKDLKTCRNTADDPEPKAYCLYPARIENGTLLIEECLNNPVSKIPPVFTVAIAEQRRFFFLRWMRRGKADCSLEGLPPHPCLYYRIFHGGHAIERTFSIPLLEKSVSIRLAPGESIRLYQDPLCEREVGSYGT